MGTLEVTHVVAKLLKEMYPQNPDIVLGREARRIEARRIIERLEADGYEVVKRAGGQEGESDGTEA